MGFLTLLRATYVYLRGVCTHTDVRQFVPLGRQIERDAVHVARQRGGAHQEDHQDAVGEQRREVNQL